MKSVEKRKNAINTTDIVSFQDVENRLARLEEEVAQLKLEMIRDARRRFEATAGNRKGSKAFMAIVREGEKIRRADRGAARANASPSNGSQPRRRARRT